MQKDAIVFILTDQESDLDRLSGDCRNKVIFLDAPALLNPCPIQSLIHEQRSEKTA